MHLELVELELANRQLYYRRRPLRQVCKLYKIWQWDARLMGSRIRATKCHHHHHGIVFPKRL